MSKATPIWSLRGQEILDSRSKATVEANVILTGGIRGRAAVRSGTSTDEHETPELRDGLLAATLSLT